MQQVQSNFTFLQDAKIITLSNVINLINMMIKKFCFGMYVCYFLDAMGERYFKVCNNFNSPSPKNESKVELMSDIFIHRYSPSIFDF